MNDYNEPEYEEIEGTEEEGVERESETAPTPEPVIEVASGPVTRVFKIGSTRIVESDETRGLTIEAVQVKLKRMYPEIANAAIRDTVKDGVHVFEFMAQPGRKG